MEKILIIIIRYISLYSNELAKKARITLLIEIAISAVLYIIGLKSSSFIILIAIIETGFLLQLELFKNSVCNRE